MKIRSAAALTLMAFISRAFLNRTAAERPITAKPSKRHPVDEYATGHDAAENYRLRRNFSRSSTSSLKKLDRYHRIYNGISQQKFGVPGGRELKVLARLLKRYVPSIA